MPFLETIPGGLGDDFPLIRRFENAWITNVDDPIHSRLRKLMLNAFSRPVVESLRPKARAVSRELLAAVDGREIDFVAEVARELPARVVTGMFGVPPGQRDQFAQWASDIQQATGAAVLTRQMVERYHQTLVELSAALAESLSSTKCTPVYESWCSRVTSAAVSTRWRWSSTESVARAAPPISLPSQA